LRVRVRDGIPEQEQMASRGARMEEEMAMPVADKAIAGDQQAASLPLGVGTREDGKHTDASQEQRIVPLASAAGVQEDEEEQEYDFAAEEAEGTM
jgi:hypothetical protein